MNWMPTTYLEIVGPSPVRAGLSPEMAAEVWAAAQVGPQAPFVANRLPRAWIASHPAQPAPDFYVELLDPRDVTFESLRCAVQLDVLTDYWLYFEEIESLSLYGRGNPQRPAPMPREQARREALKMLSREGIYL